ncbi:phosphotransferase [Allonocardiopsis opalescens]|uniref:phosphotransferase n=1 Tax=Allonocardiopsis opalescens TaxID=1144618 RepID=UPI001FEB4808|nr:phosphotransferase [Allonocardiopsis opalescens]
MTTTEGGPAWLRVMSSPRPEGKLWDGAVLADDLLDDAVPHPALLAVHTWQDAGAAFQAHVWEQLTGSVLSPTPDLTSASPPAVTAGWWRDLRAGTAGIRRTPVPPGREVVTQAYIGRIHRFVPGLAGVELTARRWETAHGDLHWANLTRDPFQIIDWEGWGAAPEGYDAAVLHAYALPAPGIAAKVREVFADVLTGETGRLAELVVAAQVIQAADRDEPHARLRPHVRRHAARLIQHIQRSASARHSTRR